MRNEQFINPAATSVTLPRNCVSTAVSKQATAKPVIGQEYTEQGDDEIIFLEDTDAPNQQANPRMLPPWKILIVDDEAEVHQVTELALQRVTYDGRELVFLSAYSAKEACAIMREHTDVAVVLLDVVMETNQAGFIFVKYLRETLQNRCTRIILRTGQPGEAPEETIIRDYDINDYKTKTELTRQKLCTSIMISLRTYEQLLAFEANQRELELLYQHIRERNRELQRAKDIAEAASLAKDEFLSLMNHELRTPLNVILMRSEILDNGIYGPLSAKQKKSLDLIRSSSHHLLSIIDDILDLAGIENGNLTVTKRRVAAADICCRSIQDVQELAEQKGIDVHYVPETHPIYIEVDERRILQVLDKLLRNAIKFSEKGTTIGIEITRNEADMVAYITIWDEGIGIAPTDLSRLFQPFVQLEHSLTRRYEGVGLGLSIASKLIHLMNGNISVASTPGMGSRFTIVLPLLLDGRGN
ncbi:MAG: HAMP domain-containing histidine kinase [Caldilineaceae bacterium]|nr:HAMP domain-containing histidine kinase [Caldilineaceae bacterium]